MLINYFSYYEFLKDLYGEDNFPFEVYNFDCETLLSKYSRLAREGLFQLGENLEVINEIFKVLRKINDQYGICKEYSLTKKINPKLGLELLEDFFNSLPSNINGLFKEVMNRNIYFVSSSNSSVAYDVSYCDRPKIKCTESLSDYKAYSAIVHEIGHCYHFNLLCGRHFYKPLDEETPSIFMEIIFNRFVDKYLYNQDYGMTHLFNRQGLFASLNNYCSVFLSVGSEFCIIDNTISANLKTDMIMEEDIKYLEELNLRRSKLFEKKIYKDHIWTDWFKYPLSNLFAIYFADIYSNDPKEGLRLLKDYITLPPSVTIEEKIKMYDITGDSYKKMIKDVHEFGKRKHLL